MAMSAEQVKILSPSPVALTSPDEIKHFEWEVKPSQTINKQTNATTCKRSIVRLSILNLNRIPI